MMSNFIVYQTKINSSKINKLHRLIKQLLAAEAFIRNLIM